MAQFIDTARDRDTVSVIDERTRQIKKKISFETPGLAKETIQAVGVRITRTARRSSDLAYSDDASDCAAGIEMIKVKIARLGRTQIVKIDQIAWQR